MCVFDYATIPQSTRSIELIIIVVVSYIDAVRDECYRSYKEEQDGLFQRVHNTKSIIPLDGFFFFVC